MTLVQLLTTNHPLLTPPPLCLCLCLSLSPFRTAFHMSIKWWRQTDSAIYFGTYPLRIMCNDTFFYVKKYGHNRINRVQKLVYNISSHQEKLFSFLFESILLLVRGAYILKEDKTLWEIRTSHTFKYGNCFNTNHHKRLHWHDFMG